MSRGRGDLSGVLLGVAALAAATPPLAARAEMLTLCGQKVDYRPAAADPAAPHARDLAGVWIGDILATNVAYSVDYKRCWALAVESVGADGKLKAKLVLADSTKNMHNGAIYGTWGSVQSWTGELGANGTTLRLASADGKSVYLLKVTGGSRMEGRVTYANGDGRVWLTRQ